MQTLPSWVERLLRTVCPAELYEQIEGDLIELYQHDIKSVGERKARLRSVVRALRFLRPGILLRNKFSYHLNPLPMFRNYLMTSLRHIRKSSINFVFKLGGLSLAIFSFLAIALYVSYQLSFDTHHRDYEKIYRVNSERKENGEVEKFAVAPLAVGPILKQYLPEVDAYARIRFANITYLRFEDKVTGCEGLIEADSSLFDVLTFNFIEGNHNALKTPNSIVLTRTKAIEIFGSTDILAKTVTINNDKQPYQVTAVIEDPTQTCFSFQAAILNQAKSSFSLESVISPVEFLDQSSTLFIKLKQSVTADLPGKVESLLDQFIKRSDRLETGFALSFQPVKDVYLGPDLKAGFVGKGNPIYVYAFSILGVLLLLVAAINYVNLSIADFGSRSGETGIRKVLGARRHQLAMQVIIETVTFSILALLIGLLLLYLLFPKIMHMLDPDLRLTMLQDTRLIITSALALAALVFLSCYLPARQFAGTDIAQSLKSKGVRYNSSISQVLLFVQFAISAVCICCTIVAGQQVGFIHNKDLGIDKKNLLVFSLPEGFSVEKTKVLKQQLKEVPGVTAVSNSSFRIGGGYWKDWYYVESSAGMNSVELYEVFSDDELFSTLGIKVLKGRTFDAAIPSDSGAAFVINETAARTLGWEEPVGKRIYTHPEEKGKWDGTVVGVVADINISPIYDKVRPLVMRLPWQSDYPDAFIYVRYQGNAQAIINAIEKKYKTVNPGYPFAFRFVDELYESVHQKENKAFAALQFTTFIIVVISMLGIFSMAVYISLKRTKEFGIRKVLGASVQQIARLHIGYFVRIVLISNLLALPIAYWLVTEWLNGFAYRIVLSYWPFMFVVIASLVLVILSGGYPAWRSGRLNPIETIKSE